MTKVAIVLALMVASTASAQQRFVLPGDTGDIPPVGYLEKMEVGDTARQLSDTEKHQLCQMFVRAAILTARQYPELDMLKIQSPVYQLFKSNFPGVAAREDPEEHAVSLIILVRYINGLPAYRADVVQLLQESLHRTHRCTQ